MPRPSPPQLVATADPYGVTVTMSTAPWLVGLAPEVDADTPTVPVPIGVPGFPFPIMVPPPPPPPQEVRLAARTTTSSKLATCQR